MSNRDYGISLTFNQEHPSGLWAIAENDDGGIDGKVVWARPATSEEVDADEYPADLRREYERLMNRPEFLPENEAGEGSPVNLVEFAGDDCAFDQPCIYGHRVEGHAVYCHNDRWLYAPRKCRRTWYTGGEVRDEDCAGFKPNPSYKPIPQP